MKKLKVFGNYVLMASLASGVFVSCSQGESDLAGGTGAIKLSIANEEGSFTTRALNESDYKLAANYTVEVKKDGSLVAGPYKGDELPNTITLPIATYTVSAYSGVERAASRDEFLSAGSEIVNLGSGEEKQVRVVCQPTCGKCVVKFDSKMDEYYNDYYVEYYTKAVGTSPVKWLKADTEPWYLLVDKDGEDVKAVIHLSVK